MEKRFNTFLCFSVFYFPSNIDYSNLAFQAKKLGPANCWQHWEALSNILFRYWSFISSLLLFAFSFAALWKKKKKKKEAFITQLEVGKAIPLRTNKLLDSSSSSSSSSQMWLNGLLVFNEETFFPFLKPRKKKHLKGLISRLVKR